MQEKSKLKVKLSIAIILFILALAMLGLGIWFSQAGKDRFKGFVDVTTEDVNAKVTAQVLGAKNTTDEGFASAKVVWDSQDLTEEGSWENIDFTFAEKDAVMELVIRIENRKTDAEINVEFSATLADTALDQTEKTIGNTNVSAYLVGPSFVGSAVNTDTPTVAEYRIVLKIADQNKDVNATKLDVALNLVNVNI